MAKILNILCPNCGTKHFQLIECKDLIFTCYKCGCSIKLTATSKEITIKLRPPENYVPAYNETK